MDIATIVLEVVLTVVLTAICTGIIVFRYQKGVEQQLFLIRKEIDERFDKAMLEYQTKFVRNHEKTAETIETLYRMYSDFRLGMTATLYKINAILSDIPILTNTVDDIPFSDDEVDSYVEKTKKFGEYYFNNRLYLPSDEMKNVIQNIVHFQGDIFIVIKFISIIHKNMPKLPLIVEKINSLVESINKTTNIHLDFVEPTMDSVLRFITVVVRNLNEQYLLLEKIHNSISRVD